MPYDPRISYRGGQYLYEGITGASQELAQTAMKALQDYEETKKQQAFGDTVMSTLANVKDPTTGQPLVSTDEQLKYAKGGHSQKQGIVMGKLSSVAQMLAQQKAEDEHKMALAHAAYYNAAADKAKQAAADDGTLYLSPEEQKAAERAGKVPLRQSAGSFQYADVPDEDSPDLDAKGNPIYSADGTMYKSGNKYKPVTAPMLQAHAIFKALEAADKSAAETAKKQPGFSPLHPSTWGIFGGPSAAAAGPAQPKTKADYDALPSGSLYTAPDGSIRRKP
jgi:hypothetical protein